MKNTIIGVSIMKNLIGKMIDHPFSTFIVVGVLVDGVSILANNLKVVFSKK